MHMEIWDLYDLSGKRTGRKTRRGEYIPEGLMHLTVDAVILNSRGETLLQRRSKEKKVYPDLWCITGGAALAGEDGVTACAREVEEELGFRPAMDTARLICSYMKPERRFLREVFLIDQDVPLEEMRYQPGEVQDAMWILPEEIEADPALSAQLHHLDFWKDIYPFILLESYRIRIPQGIYRHYKGNRYRMVGLSLHSETLEPMAIYRALYGSMETWVRPAGMWQEMVDAEGKRLPRFALEEAAE